MACLPTHLAPFPNQPEILCLGIFLSDMAIWSIPTAPVRACNHSTTFGGDKAWPRPLTAVVGKITWLQSKQSQSAPAMISCGSHRQQHASDFFRCERDHCGLGQFVSPDLTAEARCSGPEIL